jgi:hypothetical protein
MATSVSEFMMCEECFLEVVELELGKAAPAMVATYVSKTPMPLNGFWC